MKRKWAALILTVSMVCALALPARAAEQAYPDTAGHYAASTISTWSGYGVLKGYQDGTFRPDNSITRAEMAAVLDRVMGYQNEGENAFTDLPEGKWYTENILRLAAEGVFKGNPDGTMKPDEPITRQEAFAVLARVFSLEESDKPTGFSDDATISTWARWSLSAMKEAGYIQGDQRGRIRADEPITRAEVVTVLDKMVKALVNSDGTYSQDCQGNLVVNAHNVTLKDMTIAGDLIVADGVADGDVYLDKVTVEGDVILRGCGENSFHILPGCNVKNIIVTKTTKGAIRLVNESGQTIPMIWVNDGKSGVVLDGDDLGNVVIACDAPVSIASKKVQTVSVTGNAKVTVEKGSTVAKMDIAQTAGSASLTVNGKVTAVANDAKIKVNGTVGSGSSSGGSSSSGGGSSSGGSGSGGGTTPTTPTTISAVSLQLLAPTFWGAAEDADVLGVGYSAVTKWLNEDGSNATYCWKESADEDNCFLANHVYQAEVTLSPVSGYAFGNTVAVTVADGNGNSFAPESSVKSGNNWVVTLKFDKTEEVDYAVYVFSSSNKVVAGEEGYLYTSVDDDGSTNPSTYPYKWYKCTDAQGNGKTLISGATAEDYTIPASETTGLNDGAKLYYCAEVTIGGNTYTSEVTAITVEAALDASKVAQPAIEEARLMLEGGALMLHMRCSDVQQHPDLSYRIEPALVNKGGGDDRIFYMSAESNRSVGCMVYWDTNESGNTILDVRGDVLSAYFWKDRIDSLKSMANEAPEADWAARGVQEMIYLGARVRVTPVLRGTDLSDKAIEYTFDDVTEVNPWVLHYVFGTRDQLSQYVAQNDSDQIVQTALDGYPKDGIRWVVDDLENGSTHLELADGTCQVTDPNVQGMHSLQCYFELPGNRFITPVGWQENDGWRIQFGSGYLNEWMAEDTAEKTPPGLYFCYQMGSQEIYIYQVIPEIVINSGNA